MRNASKLSGPILIKLFFLLALLIPVKSGFSAIPAAGLSCQEPNASVTAQSSGSVSFGWAPVTSATSYKVWYWREADNFTSSEYSTGSTSINFSALQNGVYKFYFQTVCSDGTSGYIVIDILM